MAKRKYYRIDGTIEETDQEKNNKTLASINKELQKQQPALAKVAETVKQPVYKQTTELSFENKNKPLEFDTTKNRVDYVKPEGKTLEDEVAFRAKNLGSGLLTGATGVVQAPLQEAQSDLEIGAKRDQDWYNKNALQTLAGIFMPGGTYAAKQITKQFDKEYQKKNVVEKLLDNLNDLKEATMPPGLKEAVRTYGSLDKQYLGGKAPENVQKLTETISKPSKDLQENVAKEAEDYSKYSQTMGGVWQQVGHMLPSIAATAITKDPDLGLAIMGAGAKGMSTQEALEKGADLQTAIKIGDAKALTEILTEKMYGGIKIGGKSAYGAGALDDVVEKTINKKITKPFVNFLAKQGVAVAGEMGEEIVSDVVGFLIDKGTIDPEATYTPQDLWNTLVQTGLSTVLLNFLGGGYTPNAYKANIQQINENSGSNALYNEYKAKQEYNNQINEQNNQKVTTEELAQENQLNKTLEKQYEKQNRSEIQKDFAKNDIIREIRNDSEYQNALNNVENVNNILENQKNLDNTEQMVYNEDTTGIDNNAKLENRVSGDDLLNAQDLINEVKNVGAKVDDNGYVTVYHQTTPENAQKILDTGKMSSKENSIYFSTSENASQAEGRGNTKLEFKIPAEKLQVDDLFSDNADVKMSLDGAKDIDISDYLVKNNQNINIKTTNKGNEMFSIVAPYYEQQVNDKNYQTVKNKVETKFEKNARNIANNLGIEIDNIQDNVGGYSFDNGKGHVNELSYTYQLDKNATPEQAKMFGCLLSDLGHETQESVVVGNYTNADNADANLEYTIKLNSGDGIVKALEKAGITDYTFNKQTNELQLLLFKNEDGTFNESEILDQFERLNNELGGKINEPTKNYISSELIGSEDRQNIYEKWLESNRGQKDGQLYKSVEQAYEKVKEFNANKEGTSDSSFSNELNYQQAEDKIAKILDKAPQNKNSIFNAENRANARQEFIRAFVDKGETIKRIADATKNPNLYWLYDRMGLSRNEAQSRIGNAQTDLNGKLLRNFKDADGNKVTMSIQGIIDDAKANGISTEVLNEYLAHSLNMDRYAQGKPVFGNAVDDYTSSKRVKALEAAYPEINRVANNVWQFNKNQLQLMVDSGLISQKFANELLQKNPHYVRIQRDVENKKTKGPIIDKNGNVKINQQIQKAKGSNLDILPIMETMADYAEQVNTSARRNIFGKELAKTLSMGVEDSSISPIVSEESFGINPDLIKDNGDGTYSMTIFDDGVATVVPINKGIYDALTPNKAVRAIENNAAFKFLAWTPKKMSSIFRTLTTDKNPVFLATNFFKDIGDAPFNSKYTSTFYKNYAKAVADRVKGGNYTQLYLNLGGNQNSYFADGQFTENTKSKVGKAVDTVLKPIEVGNEYIESFPRLAEFMSTIEANGYTVNENCELVPIKGKTQKASPDVVLNEALYNAAEITTNFKRGGDFAKFLNRNGATFLNASIQGFSKQIRNFTDVKSPKQAVMLMTKALIFGVAPALINGAMYGDDDEYKEMQDYQKDNYFLFKGKDGKWIRIPYGRAMSVLGSFVRRTGEFVKGDKNAYSGFVDFAKNQIAPNSILENNIFSAISQVKNNKSWSGNKIISDSMAKKPTDEQYNEKTDEISKFLGKVLKDVPLPKEYKNFKSPMAINYLIDQYTGGIGDVVLPMISQKATSTDNPLVAPFTNKFTTDAAYSSKAIGDYYDKKEELETNKSSDKATPLDKAKYSYINSKNYEIAALYSEQHKIQNDTSLSKKEKYKKAKEKQEEINKLAKQIVKDVDKASESDYYVKIGDYYYKKVIKDGKETYVRDTSKNIPTESYALYDYFKQKYDKSKE